MSGHNQFNDSDEEEVNYENPNFRKLKATLNVKTTLNQTNKVDLKTDLKDVISSDESVKKLEEDLNVVQLNEKIKSLEQKIKNQESNKLPKNWECYQDDKGAYFWHIPSGTIQRDPPIDDTDDLIDKNDTMFYLEDEIDEQNEACKLLQPFEEINKEQSFVVYSLGSMDFDESNLTAEQSSKAIQKCIIELTTKGDNNAVRCYGSYGTKKLILKIENSCLKLYDIPTKKTLSVQPISLIKVWGLNANNDFAYVASVEQPLTNKQINKVDQLANDQSHSNEPSPQTSPLKTKSNLKCHIFHCQENRLEEFGNNEAQCIANLLKEEVIKYKLSQNEQQDNLINEYDASPASSSSLDFSTFLDEPIRTVIANYLGKIIVDKPCGVEIINQAIEMVVSERNDPIVSLVHISPSNIIIENTNTTENVLECKLCRLSFLGISQNNTKQSAFIIQNNDDKFEAFVFECRPDAVSLCKFIQDACRIRFEKYMDAHKKRDSSVLIRNGNSKAAVLKSRIVNAFSKIMMK